MVSLTWQDQPEDHDFAAAQSYLSLLLDPGEASELARSLRAASTVRHPAKDVIRAAGLALLAIDDVEVARDIRKVRKGKALSPILLVRGRLGDDVRLTVADGYHRVCAAYHLDEDAELPARIVGVARRAG